MRNRIDIPKGLYGITGDNFANGKSNYECVEEMVKGGIKIVQYRDKFKSTREKVEEAKAIKKLCHKNNVLFIVNDDVAVAMLVDADGVHVGQDDMKPDDVRKLIGINKIIGLSTHSEEQGMAAYNKHAHALGFRKDEIDRFIETTLVKIETSTMSLNDYVALTMETGKYGVQVMELLDQAILALMEIQK